MKLKRLAVLTLLLTVLLSAVSCGRGGEPRTNTYYEYFDTVSYISSYRGSVESEGEFADTCARIEEIMKKYHRLMDIYHEYDGMNNLATVNKNAGIAPVTVSEELIELLLYAKEIYVLTGGEVNVAMGSVLSLWHECREEAEADKGAAQIPHEAALRAAAEHTSIDSIVIDRSASTVYISDKDTSIDLGAIGKGYTAERAAEYLKDEGIDSYVLNFGGNIRAVGTKPDGEAWVTGITNPDALSAQAYAARISLSDSSCVTSGSYQRYFTVDGKDYHHIIDKDTLYPSEYFVSVSVITPDSALADALSTALFSMSYEDGLALCESIGEVGVIWICPDGEILMSEAINAILIK